MVKRRVHHDIEDVATGPLSVGGAHIGPTAAKQTERDMLLRMYFVKLFQDLTPWEDGTTFRVCPSSLVKPFVLLSIEQFEHTILQNLNILFLVFVCHFCGDRKDKMNKEKSIVEQTQ